MGQKCIFFYFNIQFYNFLNTKLINDNIYKVLQLLNISKIKHKKI